MKSKAILFSLVMVALAIFFSVVYANAHDEFASSIAGVGVDEHLNQSIDLTLPFVNEEGQTIHLKDLIVADRPAIFVPVYYACPNLCGLILKGVADLLNSMDLLPWRDFSVITFSISPDEKPSLAMEKARQLRGLLADQQSGEKGWHFLTGSEESIAALTNQLGVRFKKEDNGEYTHAAVLMIVTPTGKIARYFYGLTFPSDQVRYALVEAANGKIGSSLDHVFLYCFHYDPASGKYTPVIMNIVRIASGLIVIALVVAIFVFRRLEKNMRR